MDKIKKNSFYGKFAKENEVKLNQKKNVYYAINDTLALLEGEKFNLLDLECTVENGYLIIYPLDDERIYYNLKELDMVGLSILENQLLSILSEKRII